MANIPDKIETWQMTEPGTLARVSLDMPELQEGEVLALRAGRVVGRVSSDRSIGRIRRKTATFKGGRAMDVATIKKEILDLSKDEKTKILTEVMPALCREVLGDEACKRTVKAVFGIDCVKELEDKLEYMI